MTTPSGAPTFRELFEGEFAFVCRTLRRFGVRDADLGDVAQELFLTVHDRYGDYDPSRSPRPWLASFAVRFASNYRKLARHREAELGAGAGASTTNDREARDLVQRALQQLGEDRRTVLLLHDMEGVAAPEIAASMSVPLNTVYSRIRLARDDFRAALRQLGDAPS